MKEQKMDSKVIKQFIAEKIQEGLSLSRIQDLLKAQGEHLTFMEVRMIASEIEEDILKKADAGETSVPQEINPQAAPDQGLPPENMEEPLPEEPAENAPVADAVPEQTPEESGKLRGKTVVELSKLARPGAVASGTVTFGSGITAEWVVDQYGRLGLENNTGKPDQQDIKEFQQELQKLFS